MRYVVSIWDTYLAEHPGATTLPVVVPVVLDEAAFKQIIDDIRDSAAKETIVTTAEMLMEKGRQQERQRARQEAERRVLTKQLQLRFGDLSDGILHNIEHAPTDLIERWIERFATQDSLEDIFA